MHAPPAFRVDNPREAAAFVAAHPFALVCVNGPDGPVAAHLPLVAVLDPNGAVTALIGHVARANPFWRAAQVAPEALAVFRGPDAYVSPSAYPSKAIDGRQVPTWNYLAAEARGRAAVETRPEAMAEFLAPLTDAMEAGRAEPWALSDAPADYLHGLSRAIVGLRLDVADICLVRKLSQNKGEADALGVADDLQRRGADAATAIANLIRKERATA